MTEDTATERREDPIGRVIAGNLRRLRQYRGWTQKQTAERLAPYIGTELSSAAISQWEEGRNPDQAVRRFSMSEVWAICKVFNVPLARLLMPGLWEVSVGDLTDLFGEPYSSVWDDCLTGSTDNDQGHWDWIKHREHLIEEFRTNPTSYTADEAVKFAERFRIPDDLLPEVS